MRPGRPSTPLPAPSHLLPEPRPSPGARRDGRRGGLRGRQSHPAGADAALLLQPLVQGARHLLVREPLSRPRARCPRRRDRHLLGSQPVAAAVRDRAAAADSPLAAASRSSQEEARVDPKTGLFNARYFAATLRGGARARAAVRAADVADHGRPRPPARHQQHLRPPRRRRRAARDRRGLPRRSCATTTCLPRFGGEEFAILLPGDAAGAGASRSPSGSGGAVAARVLRRRDLERADPRDRLDRRRGVPARRRRRERADPSGRPRRLPGEAPGPQPRPRRELEPLVAARARATPLVAVPDDGEHARRCRAPIRRAAPRRRRRHPRPHAARTAATSSRSRGAWPRSSASSALVGTAPASPAVVFGASRRRQRTDRDHRARRRWASARARGRASDRSPSARSARSPAPRSSARVPRSRWRSRRRRSSGAPRRQSLHQRALQRRRAVARLARGRGVFSLHFLGGQRDRPHPAIVAGVAAVSPTSRVNMGLRQPRRRPSRATSAGCVSSRSASPGSVPHYLVYGFIAGGHLPATSQPQPLGARRLRGAAAS